MGWFNYKYIVAALIIGVGIWQLVRARKLVNRCTAFADGRISKVGSYVETGRTDSGRTTRTTRYHPYYEFEANGQTITVTGKRGKGKRAYQEGEAVEIRYNPDNPEEFVCAKDGWQSRAGILSIVLGAMFIATELIKLR